MHTFWYDLRMENLLAYLNDLASEDQISFAVRCGTSINYLRKACSVGQRLGEKTCINIERESGGVIRCEVLRPDVDWAYLRNSEPTKAGSQTAMAKVAIDVIAVEGREAIQRITETVEAEIKHVAEELIDGKPSEKPWNGVTERRQATEQRRAVDRAKGL